LSGMIYAGVSMPAIRALSHVGLICSPGTSDRVLRPPHEPGDPLPVVLG